MNAFNNRACHAIALWRDAASTQPNLTGGLVGAMRPTLGDVAAEDFFAYCYAVLATPSYIETFSEDLTVPGPRVPVTSERNLFQHAVRLGRRLIWLHTYGERFVPQGHRTGEVPRGRVRCSRAVDDRLDHYPEEFSYNETTRLLRVGQGEFGPVPNAVWDFSVSGFQVVHSWLSYRMKDGAGRSSSPLDEIRPERWTADMTEELLELLWVLETTVAMFPDLDQILDAIVASQTFRADELPQPTSAEREPPATQEQPPQTEMDIA
jgi:hypothetical protein